jgi:hypothetical protein
MTEQPDGGRDVLAELDSIGAYLAALCGSDPQPGLDADKARLPGEMQAMKDLAANIVELAAAYASGITHEERVRRSSGAPASDADSELDRLRAENEALKGGAVSG